MAINLTEDDHSDDELIEDARMNASTKWEEDFVSDIIGRRKTYGLRFMLTPAQRSKLEQIAEGPSEDTRRHRR